MMQGEGQQAAVSPMEIARQWAELPPAHLKTVMAAMERQLEREHTQRMRELDLEDSVAQNRSKREMAGLKIGGLLAIGFLVLTGWLATSQPIVAGITGAGGAVTLVLLVKMFVLQQAPSDADMKALVMQQKQMVALAGQPPAPATAPGPAADPAPITQP
ncbi:hypothetical protein ACIRBX_00085 [Kitasatospora sp. NPDC096147]|uniref:hypothetical protein n=1 Tax=Kitasatospora sp. NPDC096147 TaxID=3364093 RepID=UPI00380C7F08